MPELSQIERVGAAAGKVVREAHAMPWRIDTPVRPNYLRDPSQLIDAMHDLVDAHPDSARLVRIGVSRNKLHGHGGYDLYALLIGRHIDDATVPRVWFNSGTHAREIANNDVLLGWNELVLAREADGDRAYRALLEGRTVGSTIDMNPDSLEEVITGLESGNREQLWRRTNQAPHGGVDPNRNMSAGYGAGDAKPGGQNYRGEYAFSEPETQAQARFGLRFRPGSLTDVHSPGGVILKSDGAGPADATRMSELVQRATGYDVSTSEAHWNKHVGGTLKDWGAHELGIPSITAETGAVHHQTDQQFVDTVDRMYPAFDALAATVDGTHAAPAGAERLALPPRAKLWVPEEHLQGTRTQPHKPGEKVPSGDD